MKHFFFIFLTLLPCSNIFAGAALLAKIAQETDVQKQIDLFFSVFPDPATTYPELHQVDDAVTLIFDQTLGLPPTLLRPLQRFYAYLKQRAVNDHLATIMIQDGKKQVSLLSALNNAQEQLQLAHLHKDTEVIPTWTKRIATLTTQKQKEISAQGPAILNLCSQTKEWQNHLKIFLVNSFTYEYELLGNINQDEIKMFTYIPQFETAYYSGMYAQLRNDAEYVRIFLVMSSILRQRVKAQCTDWKDLTDLELYDEIEKFKKTDFYLFAKQFETISSQTVTTPLQYFSLKGSSIAPGYADYLTCTQTTDSTPVVTAALGLAPLFVIKNNVPSLTSLGSFLLKEGTITPKKGTPYPGLIHRENFNKLFIENMDGRGHLPSSLFMELLSFNAINLLNQNNSYLFNQANLADTMQRLNQLRTTSSTLLSSFPNVIFYQPEDQLFLEDINALTAQVITPPPVGAAQPACGCVARFFHGDYDHDIDSGFHTAFHAVSGFLHGHDDSAIDHGLKKAGDAIGSGLKTAGDAIGSGLETAGDAISHGLEVALPTLEKIGEIGAIAIFCPFILPVVVPVMFTDNTLSNNIQKGVQKAAQEFANSVQKIFEITVDAADATFKCIKAVSLDIGDMTVAFATGHFHEGFEQMTDVLDDTLTGVEAVGTDAANAAMTLVNGVAQIASTVVAIGASVLGTVVATVTQDPQLGTDLAGTIDAVADTVIDAVRDCDDMLIQAAADVVILTAEATLLIAKVIVATVEAFTTGDFKNMGNTIADSANQFLQDTVQAILGMISLAGKALGDALKNVMVSVAYLTAALTDLVEVVASDYMAFGAFLVGGPEAAAEERDSVMTEMNKHRRLISAIVGTVLMVAVTVATLGAAGPLAAGFMIALTVGMMVPALVGANQQDMDASQELATQEAFLARFREYVQQCGPAQAALQQNLLAETGVRLQEQAINADRGLVYYQNYVNNSLNTTHAVQAYQTSSFYDILTTPDITNYPPNGVLPADPGYSYGIQTTRMDLNPSQGFRVYSATRGTFAQEIATLPAPLLTTEQINDSFSNASPTPTLTQHFITQKDLCNLTTSNKTVTVRWRVIYESQGDFYIGIYLNKNYLDTKFLNFLHSNFESVAQGSTSYDQKTFDNAWLPLKTFNTYLYKFDHLAQAFVCYKNRDTQHIPALGIYQHLGKGFISSNNQPSSTAWFKRGSWYIMTATATDTHIKVAFSEENNPHVTWSSSAQIEPLAEQQIIPYETLMSKLNYTAQQQFTGSFGIITSGAAVEYEVLTPQQSVTQTTQRQASNTTVASSIQNAEYSINGTQPPVNELQREQQWIQNFEQNIKPSFAGWTLTPFSELTVAQGTYVYSTTNTKLSTKSSLTDFVVSLANPPAPSSIATIGMNLLNSSAQIGNPITSTTQYMLSLVTGNCYNTQGSLVITYPDALPAYLQQNPTLPTQLSAAITRATQAYYTNEVGGFVFHNVTVTGVLAALKKDVFIYTCPSFTQYLSGLDYLVFVNIPQGSQNPGTTQSLNPLLTNNSINCAISLVTGKVFNLVSGNPPTQINQLPSSPWKNITLTPSGATYPATLQTYQAFIDGKTLTTIQHQINSYTTAEKAAQQALIQAQLHPPKPITPPVPALPPAPVPSMANLQALFGSSMSGLGGGGGLSFSG